MKVTSRWHEWSPSGFPCKWSSYQIIIRCEIRSLHSQCTKKLVNAKLLFLVLDSRRLTVQFNWCGISPNQGFSSALHRNAIEIIAQFLRWFCERRFAVCWWKKTRFSFARAIFELVHFFVLINKINFNCIFWIPTFQYQNKYSETRNRHLKTEKWINLMWWINLSPCFVI